MGLGSCAIIVRVDIWSALRQFYGQYRTLHCLRYKLMPKTLKNILVFTFKVSISTYSVCIQVRGEISRLSLVLKV